MVVSKIPNEIYRKIPELAPNSTHHSTPRYTKAVKSLCSAVAQLANEVAQVAKQHEAYGQQVKDVGHDAKTLVDSTIIIGEEVRELHSRQQASERQLEIIAKRTREQAERVVANHERMECLAEGAVGLLRDVQTLSGEVNTLAHVVRAHLASNAKHDAVELQKKAHLRKLELDLNKLEKGVLVYLILDIWQSLRAMFKDIPNATQNLHLGRAKAPAVERLQVTQY